jgi:hypothetical protein
VSNSFAKILRGAIAFKRRLYYHNAAKPNESFRPNRTKTLISKKSKTANKLLIGRHGNHDIGEYVGAPENKTGFGNPCNYKHLPVLQSEPARSMKFMGFNS